MTTCTDPKLSLAEAARLLDRSVAEVRELIEEGELGFAPTSDIRTIAVPASAVDEFLEHHRP